MMRNNAKTSRTESIIQIVRKIVRLLRRLKLLNHTVTIELGKRLELISNLDSVDELQARIRLFDAPFYFDPLRTTLRELLGPSGLGKMRENDCYGLRYIDDPQPVILDVGAHIGLLPRVVKQRFPAARILSLEPDRENFELLAKNNALVDGAESLQLGVFGESGLLKLRVSDQNSWRSTIEYNEAFFESERIGDDSFRRDEYEVPVVTIDELVEQHHLDRLTLLGITVPGEIEVDILKGATRTLETFHPIVAIVLYESQAAEATALLDRYRYRVIGRHAGHHIFQYADQGAQRGAR